MHHLPARSLLLLSLFLSTSNLGVFAQDKVLADKLAKRASMECQEMKTAFRALPHINEAIKLDPDNGSFYALRAYVYLRMEEDREALDDINHAIKLNPKAAYFHESKATILAALKRNNEALEEANKAVEMEPNCTTKLTRATILMNMGNLQEAKVALDKLAAEEKSDFRPRMRRIPLNKKLNCWDAVVEDSNFMIKFADKNSYSYKLHVLDRGIAYTKLKQYDKAEQDLKQAGKALPDVREVHQALLALYEITKRPREAMAEKTYLNELDEDIKPFK
ncbi:MAG: hypothetical protein KGS72_14315 [Cyanobacteria bacterium REEB67]|nr:hypothetical protein [Cyanobacteria bacterium REEB67]